MVFRYYLYFASTFVTPFDFMYNFLIYILVKGSKLHFGLFYLTMQWFFEILFSSGDKYRSRKIDETYYISFEVKNFWK